MLACSDARGGDVGGRRRGPGAAGGGVGAGRRGAARQARRQPRPAPRLPPAAAARSGATGGRGPPAPGSCLRPEHPAAPPRAQRREMATIGRPQARRRSRPTSEREAGPRRAGQPARPVRHRRAAERVLDAWTASPARFREDANAEEDYALGGYRDRVIVELAQNAADAAARGGRAGPAAADPGRRDARRGQHRRAPGRGGRRRAVHAAGLRQARARRGRPARSAGSASASRPRWRSATSRDRLAAPARWPGRAGPPPTWSRQVPALAAELAARSGHVPVLRLPFAAPGEPPAGFATAVTLPLRDEAAAALVERLLAETGPALLLALPALAEIEIEAGGATRVLTAAHDGDGVTITAGGTAARWRTVAAAAPPTPRCSPTARPRSAPARPGRCAGPCRSRRARTATPRPAACPTGSAPSCTRRRRPTSRWACPRCCSRRFPLSPDRRHVAPGPLTDFLLDQAADAYARLLPSPRSGTRPARPGPGPGRARRAGRRLRRAILDRLPETAFLPAAEEPGLRVRPRDAVVLDTDIPGLAGFLAPVLSGLVAGPARHPAFAVLGVRRLRLAELADLLAALDRDPAWWRRLYAALAAARPRRAGRARRAARAAGRRAAGPRPARAAAARARAARR